VREVVIVVFAIHVLDEREVEISLSESESSKKSEEPFSRNESFVEGLIDGAIETSRAETRKVEGFRVKER
jgi:hypothetical protein